MPQNGIDSVPGTMHKNIFAVCLAVFALAAQSVNGADLPNGGSLNLNISTQEANPVFYVARNTITPAMRMYLDAVTEKIQQNGTKDWPKDVSGKPIPGVVVVRITLRKDGFMEDIQTNSISGRSTADNNDALSESVTRLVKGAQPFPPFPPSLFGGYELIAFGTTVGFSQSAEHKTTGEPHFGAQGNNQRFELRSRIPF